ncbi:MAG: SgcJ/EcaC family oxidoreductase [Chloroflexales bacterium]|nr:SgcJ/EcaC family oxidoreductase [Chloroflexales bacterium]
MDTHLGTSAAAHDEQAIRALVARWLEASATGDLPALLSLMAEDVVFLTPGQPPIRGRDAFAADAQQGQYRIEASGEVREVQVNGDWAYCWSQLVVTVTPLETGSPVRRSGPTLTILRKEPDGRWVVFRDANMLTLEASA